MSVHGEHKALRGYVVILFVIISFSKVCAQETLMKMEFLGMKDGCPNTPKLWLALQDALTELNWEISIDSLDVIELSRQEDLRAGYGSPTILVEGKDLFGASLPQTFDPACRYYRNGLPGTSEIAARLSVYKR